MTAETIFDLDLRKRSVKKAAAAEEEEKRQLLALTGETRSIDSELVAVNVDLFRSRPMNWIQTRAVTWVLGLGDGFVRLSPVGGDHWDVHCLESSGQTTLLRLGLPLGYAQGVAEDFARKRGAGALLNPAARWRSDPATDKQIKWLRWKRVPVPAGLTKGEAYDLIAAIKGG